MPPRCLRYFFLGQDTLHYPGAIAHHHEGDFAARPGGHHPSADRDRLADVGAKPADLYCRHAISDGRMRSASRSVESSPAPGKRQRGLRELPAATGPAGTLRARRRADAGLELAQPAGGSPAWWVSRITLFTWAAWIGRSTAVDLISGEVRWSVRLSGMVAGGVLVSGDTVFVATSRPEGQVYALRRADGKRIWRVSHRSDRCPLALVQGLLVAQTQRGEVIGLDPGNRQDPLAPPGWCCAGCGRVSR